MNKLSFFLFSSILLLGVTSCKQSNAEQELAQLRDSLNNAKMEQQKLYDDSVKKVQEEQRQQAIEDSIAEAKRQEAANTERSIPEELRKFLLGQNSRINITSSAQRDIANDATWRKVTCFFCQGDMHTVFAPSEGSNFRVSKEGRNQYRFSARCPECNAEAGSVVTLKITPSQNGEILLQHVFWDRDKEGYDI